VSGEEVYVLPDGDTIVFSPEAHQYALAEYGTLAPHFCSPKRSRSLIYDLQRDNFLKVTEDNGCFSVRENESIPKEFKNRMKTIGDLERKVLVHSLMVPESNNFDMFNNNDLPASRLKMISFTELLRLYGLISYN